MRTAAALALLAGGAWWLARRVDPPGGGSEIEISPAIDYGAAWHNAAEELMRPFEYVEPIEAQTNVDAFLATIRHAEGTAGRDGYRTMFGGKLFDSYADHPRIAHRFTDRAGRQLWTSAAGAFQFMAVSPLPSGGSTRVNTWDRLKAKLSLPDFSPASQDRAAVELLDEAGALVDVQLGRFVDAVAKVRRTWASLPGAGYAQPERTLEDLVAVYRGAGGGFA